jgi:hypothetical protein
MGAENGQEQTYQWMLRALGAFLDQEPSCRISLAEVPEGFVVRLQRGLHKLEPTVLRLSRRTLVAHLGQLKQHRPSAQTRPHHQGIWTHFPNGHQDFFRALGYELDQASAHGILLDELEEGLVVTYSCPDPETGARRKRMVSLRLPEIEQVLNAAFERRQNR